MLEKIRIGFIQANNDVDIQTYKPLAFGYLKSFLEMKLKDRVEMSFLEDENVALPFHVIGISSTSQNFSRAKNLARKIKDRDPTKFIALGGHHITSLPETLGPEFDIGVRGEGEQTFFELISLIIENGIVIEPELLANIKGLIYHHGNRVVQSPAREPIFPLEQLPVPYRDKGSSHYLFSSRGCPYRCAFCGSSSFWGAVRYFSPEYVVNEIESILEYCDSDKSITVWDDLFVADRKRFKQIIETLEKRGIRQEVSFTFSVRANLVNEELCRDLKLIRVSEINFGAESGSNRILGLLDKGTTVEMNQEAIDLLRRHGFSVRCSFIVGCPTETAEEVRSTYEFLIRNVLAGKLPHNCPVNILMPIPGTKVWNEGVRAAKISPANFDWERLGLFASYRDSGISNFADWAVRRRINGSLYLAENSLPEEVLLKMMGFYEDVLAALGERAVYQDALRNSDTALRKIMGSRGWKMLSQYYRLRDLITAR